MNIKLTFPNIAIAIVIVIYKVSSMNEIMIILVNNHN